MFTPKTLSFLRALKRNNRREWFQPRKEEYERHVRAPMMVVVERLAGDLRTFAPELIADPKVSLFLVYRDTRFSSDKTPYKTHAAARFPLGPPDASAPTLVAGSPRLAVTYDRPARIEGQGTIRRAFFDFVTEYRRRTR